MEGKFVFRNNLFMVIDVALRFDFVWLNVESVLAILNEPMLYHEKRNETQHTHDKMDT